MTQQNPPRARRSSGLLPIVLILVGVLLLLANFGWMSWGSILDVVNLWPVLLLAIGADMLTHGRYRGAVVLGALVVGGALFAYESQGGTYFGSAAAETHTIEHPIGGASSADVSLANGVSTLHVGALRGGDLLVRGEVATGRGESLTDDFFRRGNQAVLQLRSEQGANIRVFNNDRRRWDLDLAAGVPTSLQIDTGVGRAQLDLGDLTLTALRVTSGVGELTATLPAHGGYEATVKAGVGATTLHIPAGVPARLTVKTGLGSVNVRGDFQKEGDVYTTPDYDGASDRVDIRVEGGLGAIDVDRAR